MKKVVLSLEYRCFPVWIYGEDGIVEDNDVPEEWEKDSSLVSLLEEIQAMHDARFTDDGKVFEFHDFASEEDRVKIRSLIEEARGKIKRMLPSGYQFEDWTKTHHEV